MTMTPKDALLRASEALDLEWTAEQQIDAVTGVVEKLASELTSPESLLRTVQVLWLPDGAKDRASAKRALRMLAEGSVMLAQGPAALGWAKVAAWAALRTVVETDRNVAAVVSLMRSAAEWISMPSRYGDLVTELIVAARSATSSAETSPAAAFAPFAKWPTAASTAQALAEPARVTALAAFSADPATLPPALMTYGVHIQAVATAVRQIEAYLGRPLPVPDAVSEPLDLLWWGQALYSPLLDKSYRELAVNHRLFWMADDMAELSGNLPSEQRVAYFTETLRRVGVDLDASRLLREHARDLVAACTVNQGFCAPPDALVNAIELDPTGFPTILLSMGTRKAIPSEALLEGLTSKLDMDLDREVSPRQWATWVCRERHLLQYLHGMVA